MNADERKGILLRSPLKWAGGKRWLVPVLADLYAATNGSRLVEPFAGGMSVYFGIGETRALLNDVNPHVINFFAQIQSGLTIRLSMKNEEHCFYDYRDRFNALIRSAQHNTQEAAELFYYLNRTGFNGLCRFNKKGFFNVPFGRYKTIQYQKTFPEHASALKGAVLTSGDFEHLALVESDFLYVDPPYDVPFTSYSAQGFSWSDQERLGHWCHNHKGPTLISNQATPRVLELYRDLGFQITLCQAPRRISCTGDRTPAEEVLALRNIPDRIVREALYARQRLEKGPFTSLVACP